MYIYMCVCVCVCVLLLIVPLSYVEDIKALYTVWHLAGENECHVGRVET